ncbi:MAG: inorganic phosphate transporter [Bacteroidales bacterium]|nr:inorganic phosphate transporter [Bacteroidales bacterium]MDY2916367.1 inorganic phosphate transporter [Muribaculaceae bacterium]
MDLVFLGLVVFLFLLAVFDLSVGVSNDAVNFLSSAVGSRAASFRRIIVVAAIGVFVGAAMSNGMMDVARHGIFRPENLSFYDVIAIFMAVMVTDIILLDIFNSLGMPTSTTVSLVFELLGATFVVALFKIADPANVNSLGEFLNTEKALSVILGIFLSVVIAFVFGTIVQFLTRLIFTFRYKSRLRWKAGIFGGIACTAILYFMLFKGVRDLTFMTEEVRAWMDAHTVAILGGALAGFTLLMQLLHALGVNVFKVVVILGTFSLAMAFAGNDLVNFVGVPLTSLAAYQDYAAAGGGDLHGFMMSSLNGPAQTPFYFLVGAGGIMVIALSTSRKARQVTQTTVGLSAKSQGDELFGSSRIGRATVRAALGAHSWVTAHTPARVRAWVNRRMDPTVTQEEDGAAFDLIRGSVNLMLAALLIAFGTSLRLPLSTTFVTFMVAMGTSLADKAWGRESAVFRVTGVISVIGGWFITAGVAFIGAGMVVCLMHMGGVPVMVAGGIIALALLVRSNIRFRRRREAEQKDSLFQTILTTEDPDAVWPLLIVYINEKQKMFLDFATETFDEVTRGFMDDSTRLLSRSERALITEKDVLKTQRRRLTLCLRRVTPRIAIEKRAWFFLANSMAMSMTYNLRHINEVCKEHVDNNFRPLPAHLREDFAELCDSIRAVLRDAAAMADAPTPEAIDSLRLRATALKDRCTTLTRSVYDLLQRGDAENMTVAYVYLNVLQETQEFITSLRKLLRANGKLNLTPSSYRSFSSHPTLRDNP